jgi:hypothetical protein
MSQSSSLIPAALYLRMSTEHQQYSLENQSTAMCDCTGPIGVFSVTPRLSALGGL